jgi:hypothetical protein
MQTRAAGATREEQHSLAPIQLEATGLARDLASIKRGQGKRLVLALLGSLLAMAALLQWMKSSDGHSAYASAARRLDALYARQESAFADCSLMQPQASQQVLRTVIEAASQHYGKAYEKQLAACSHALVVLERQLSTLDVPLSMEHRLDGLQIATSALNRAIGSYRSYLFDPRRNYDFTIASTYIDKVVTAWGNYDVQRLNTVDALRTAAQRAEAR